MSYILELENYQGPIEKLLELVEEKKMEITLVNVARVTDEFLVYYQKLKEAETQAEESLDLISHADLKSILSDFLVIASRLVLIKSRVLLPSLDLSDEEEASTRDLEWRIKIYQEVSGAKSIILNLWQSAPLMCSRDFLMTREPVFYPPSKIGSEELFQAATRLIGEIEKFLMPVKEIKTETINLKAKIEEVLAKLSREPGHFSDLSKEQTRGELIVLFLAILHLIRDQLIHAEQEGHFGSIFIAKNEEKE